MWSNTYLLRANPEDWRLLLLDEHGSHKSIEFIWQCLECKVSDGWDILNICKLCLRSFHFALFPTQHISARLLMLSSLARCNESMGKSFLSIKRTMLTSIRLSSATCSSGSMIRFFKQATLFKPFWLVVCALWTLQPATPTSRSLYLKWLTWRMIGLTQG